MTDLKPRHASKGPGGGVVGHGPRRALVAGVRSAEIEALVDRGPSSARLRNTIAKGASKSLLPCRTVGEYVDAGDLAPLLFKSSLWSFGVATARELDFLVDSFLHESGVGATECVGQGDDSTAARPGDDERKEEILALLDGVTYADALKGGTHPSRLARGIENLGLLRESIADFFRRKRSVHAHLLEQENFGAMSYMEIKDIIHTRAIAELARNCPDPEVLLDQCLIIFETADHEKQELVKKIDEIVSSLPPANADLQGLLEWGLSLLMERRSEVIRRRYALDGRKTETLDEIAGGASVSRERIRQIEEAGIKKLAALLEYTPFRTLLRMRAEEFWEKRRVPHIRDAEIHGTRKDLPAHMHLALDVSGLTPKEWMAEAGTALRNGVVSSGLNSARVAELGEEFRRIESEGVLPTALGNSYKNVDTRTIDAAAACVGEDLRHSDGYLFPRRSGIRERRGVDLHRLLREFDCAAPTYNLFDAYKAEYPDDRCGLPDISVAMKRLPNLFIQIQDNLWCPLGCGLKGSIPPLRAEPADEPSSANPGTVTDMLYRWLEKRRPTPMGDLHRRSKSILTAGQSTNSIAPILMDRVDLFSRVLPGVYALREKIPGDGQLLDGPLPYLLNMKQARSYVYGRRAGEPWGTFPLWNPVTEYRLCKWAKSRVPKSMYRSLLSIASIDDWPVEDKERANWMRAKEREGRFEIIKREPPRDQDRIPELDRVLAACLLAVERGALNWMSINRVMGKRQDAATGGRGLLAFAVVLGCVRTPDGPVEEQFFLPHAATGTARKYASRLSKEMMRTGKLDWDSGFGRDVLAKIRSAPREDLGWVSEAGILDMLA